MPVAQCVMKDISWAKEPQWDMTLLIFICSFLSVVSPYSGKCFAYVLYNALSLKIFLVLDILA